MKIMKSCNAYPIPDKGWDPCVIVDDSSTIRSNERNCPNWLRSEVNIIRSFPMSPETGMPEPAASP